MFMKSSQDGQKIEVTSSAGMAPYDLDSSKKKCLSSACSDSESSRQLKPHAKNTAGWPPIVFNKYEATPENRPCDSPVYRRGPGRPRKNPLALDKGRTNGNGGDQEKVTVKRGRGRPQKRSPQRDWIPPVSRPKLGLDSADDNIFDKLTCNYKRPETDAVPACINESRPLTRGALGKDFPSAKKQSWIDVEKELYDELDSE